jgi:hypothetical protein
VDTITEMSYSQGPYEMCTALEIWEAKSVQTTTKVRLGWFELVVADCFRHRGAAPAVPPGPRKIIKSR